MTPGIAIAIRMGLMIAALLASGSPAAAQADTVRRNIAYGSYSGLSLLMDIHVPAKPTGRALLYIPGSGFQAPLGMEPFGIKDSPQVAATLAPFLARGFTVFAINHRAAPRFTHPAPLEDTRRAARFIRANAASFAVSPDWLGVAGGSSGGNLALMLATARDEASGAGETPVPQCVAAFMAPTDLLPLGQDGIAVALATQHVGVVAPFPDEEKDPDAAERLAAYRAASPLFQLDAQDRSRFLLLHGDRDRLVPPDQSQRFADRARELGLSADIRIMPGVGHSVPAGFAADAAAWMADCAKS